MTTPTPQPMPTPDLGSLLRTPGRGDVAPKTTAPRGSAGPPRTPMLPGRTTMPMVARAPDPSRPAAALSDSELTPAGGKRTYLRSISVYLPRTLHRTLHEEAARRSTTATATMLTAVSATHATLEGALPDSREESVAEGLFDIPQARQKSAEPRVATTIRVTDAQHQALTALTARYGVSRSEVISAALRIHLGVTGG